MLVSRKPWMVASDMIIFKYWKYCFGIKGTVVQDREQNMIRQGSLLEKLKVD